MFVGLRMVRFCQKVRIKSVHYRLKVTSKGDPGIRNVLYDYKTDGNIREAK